MTRRLLAIHAHPDDESSKGAATLARYAADGAEVLVVSCTGGELGDIQNPQLTRTAHAKRDIAGLRRLELERARSIIGFQHRWLGYRDSGLPAEGEALEPGCFALVPLELSAEPMVRILREFRPQVVISYDESGGYPHPDHIRTHELTVAALDAAADPSAYPDAGAPWAVSKLYYDRSFNASRAEAVFGAIEEREPDHPMLEEFREYRAWLSRRPDTSTTHIECAEHFEARDDALRAHESQVAPDSRFFFWPNELQAEVWPWEDYELARSTVDTTLPENDLFAGLDL